MLNHLYEFTDFREEDIHKKIPELEENLTAFSQVTDIPVSFYSTDGNYLWCTIEDKKICMANAAFGREDFGCTANLLSSMNIAASLPDPYMFLCNAGLLNFCMPLIYGDKMHGFLIAGPIAMGSSMEKLVSFFLSQITDFQIDYPRIISVLRKMKLFKPDKVSYLSTLLRSAVTASLGPSAASSLMQQRYREQSDIGSCLIRLKKENRTAVYPHESETALLTMIQTGNVRLCKETFENYVNDLILFEGGNVSLIKLRLITFLTPLVQSGEGRSESLDFFFYLKKINDTNTLNEILQLGETLASSLAESASHEIYAGASPIVRQVILYIHAHYRENIHLRSAAADAHVNPTYLSTLFKQEMQIAFSAYLNQVRLKQAELLLKTTNLPVTEICINCGFSSPSYFTKLFKSEYGITPKEYRYGCQ